MHYETIEDFLKTLTLEEIETNKEIILECLAREEILKEITASRQSAMDGLTSAVVSIVKSLHTLSGATQETLGATQEVLKTTQKTQKIVHGVLSTIRRGQLDVQRPVGSA